MQKFGPMVRAVCVLSALASGFVSSALARDEGDRPFASVGVSPLADPISLKADVMSLKEIDVVRTDILNFDAAITESNRSLELGNPLRFAIPVPVVYTLDNSGTWETLKDGRVAWRLRVGSPDAMSINLGFTRFSMPKGGTMTLLTPDGAEVVRPFTSDDNKDHGQLWTPPLNASEIVVEVVLPDEKAAGNLELELGQINAGFRHFGAPSAERGTSGSCNVDVACSEGDPWRDQIAAVGAYTVGGIDTCSGSMVNNTAQNRVPYFLTAFHCGVDAGDAPSVVIFWNFQNSTCRTPGTPASGGAGDGSLAQFSSGTTFRAGSSPSDFTLLQVNTPPDPAWGVTFAGWSRTGAYPLSGACIHHPGVAEKRITLYDIAVRPTRPTHGSSWGCSAFPGPGDETHISVYWSLGVTEGGSSGSPLYDNDKRIIGQLHGGPSSCSQTGDGLSDCYGRVFRSWTGGGTAATRLSDWLDPTSSGALFVDTLGKGLNVSPSGDTTHLGLVGGPFSPNSVIYTLDNSTATPINYNVSFVAGGTAPLTLNGGAGPVSGSLAAMTSTTVTVAVDPAANALASGLYNTTVKFDDLSNGFSVNRVHTIDAGTTNFTVTPATGLAAGGPVGGPFSATQAYTITSTKPTPVNIQVAGNATWIGVDGNPSTTFTLSGVGDSRVVTVGYAVAANALAAGIYNGAVSFTNLTNAGIGDTSRSVSLDVGRYTYTYPGPGIPIPDNNTTGITSTLSVPDAFCVGDVDVDVNITHTFIGDLIVELVSPDGTVVRLHNRTGGSADNIVRTYNQGVVNPDGPGALTDFDGRAAQGVWTLRVSDVASTDVGTLATWSLRIAASGAPCAPLAVNKTVTVPDTVTSPIALMGSSATGAPLTYTIASLATNGTLRDPTGNVLITTVPYTLASGSVVNYKPNSLFAGNDSFTYFVSDSLPSPTATVSIKVGVPAPIINWNMDVNPGWTLEPDWAYGVPQGLGGDPASGFTGTNVIGYNLAGAYPNNLTPRRYATTPVINLSGKTQTSLSFRRWLGVESSTFDKAGIEISINGSTWTSLFANPAATINENAWSLQTIDISAIADNQATVTLRWYLGTTDSSVTFEGWNLDDVVISGVTPPTAPPPCLGDANRDGFVTFADVTSVLNNFNATGAPGIPGDANLDGAVTFADITNVLNNFNVPCP